MASAASSSSSNEVLEIKKQMSAMQETLKELPAMREMMSTMQETLKELPALHEKIATLQIENDKLREQVKDLPAAYDAIDILIAKLKSASYLPVPETAPMPETAPVPEMAGGGAAAVSEEMMVIPETWDDMQLHSDVQKCIANYGFEKPTAPQQKAIPPMMRGKNVLIQAPSGQGKTAAFVISLLQQIAQVGGHHASKPVCHAVILCNTNDLASQHYNTVLQLSKGMGITAALLTTSFKPYENAAALAKGVHIVVATSGRLWDMTAKKEGRPAPTWHNSVRVMIIDEVDALLSGNSLEQVKSIWQQFPQRLQLQLGLFSATLPHEVIEQAESLLGPDHVSYVGKSSDLPASIKHYAMDKPDFQSKAATTMSIVKENSVPVIIFCNSKETVLQLTKEMQEEGFMVASVHKELQGEDRDKTISDFKTGKLQVIVTTNVLARGFDCKHLQLVINFDLPQGPGWWETYVHQSGRCGRGGCVGVCVNLLTAEEGNRAIKMVEGLKINLMVLEDKNIGRILK
jgi:superfamily II DNA/RNA helicase